jgi:predicted aspartyl protease
MPAFSVLKTILFPLFTGVFIWLGSIEAACLEQVRVVNLPPIQKIEILHADFTADSAGGFETIVIPLKRAGRIFLIEANVDGVTGNFVFDTGADKMVLNKTYFRKDLIAFEEGGGGVAGNSKPIYVTQVKNISASGLLCVNQTVDVTELGQIENRRGVKILGLMGMTLFSGMSMEIDLRNGYLKLIRLTRKGEFPGPDMPMDSTDFQGKIELVRKIMFLRAAVGGRTLDFCLDTGAESNVISSEAPKKVMETISITGRSELTGVGGSASEIFYGTMNDFSLGSLNLAPMQTIIASLTSLSQAYDYPVGGVLGYDFFEQGIVCINLVTKELKIKLHERKRS